MFHRIKCSEIWGGIHGDELDAESSGVRASLFSRACDGGKGGDIYYFSVCGSDLLTRIALADVVGHGERVSKASQWLYESLESNMNSGDGTQVLTDLNRAAEQYGYEAMATAVVAAIYREDSHLYFSYAGHHEVLLSRGGEAEWTPILAAESDGLFGLPLGVSEQTNYEQHKLQLHQGDQLFLYTDGLIEAPDAANELFGLERLLATLNNRSESGLAGIRKRVLDSLLKHTDRDLGHDDVTFMAVEILG